MWEMMTKVCSGAIFHAVLERQPVPAVRLNPEVPAELERIINRALEKDRELRYQHASEMRSELLRLKRDTDSGRILSSGSGAVHELAAEPATPSVLAEAICCVSLLRRTLGSRLCGISLLAPLEHTERPRKDYENQPVEQTDERS